MILRGIMEYLYYWSSRIDLVTISLCQQGTDSGRSVDMGKWAEAPERTEVRLGQGIALSSGAMALSGVLPGGRQTGILQQPRRAQH